MAKPKGSFKDCHASADTKIKNGGFYYGKNLEHVNKVTITVFKQINLQVKLS